MKAIVIGGGIGGFTAAIALNQAGIDAHIYERAAELREVGAGISLWANAINALAELGLADAIRARSQAELRGAIRTWRGTILSQASYEQMAGRLGVAIVVMHRADLLMALAGEVDPKRLHAGHECVDFTQDANGVTARFANGEVARGDVLIGADGLHSVVRAQLFGGDPPVYSGYTAWRAVVRMEHPRMVSGESWGTGRRFGIVPMGGGQVYWYATKNAPEGERDEQGRAKGNLAELFRGWHEPIEALIEATDETAILRNDIYDREPLSRWNDGRVTLLGDAAHPMTPNLGQGACQAIEDAVVLAVCLRKAERLDAGLREYQERRISRTSEMVIGSRRAGEMGQWENSLACWLRNAAMRAAPRGMMARRVAAMAEYKVLAPGEHAFLCTDNDGLREDEAQ